MALTAVWYWVSAGGMAVGTLLAAWWLVRDPARGRYYAVLGSITGIATVAYVVMALGIGRIEAAGGTLLLPRYVDWLLTTPLLVLYLGMLCRPDRSVYAGLIGADVTIIGAGIVAGLLPEPGSWIAYGIGVVAYLGLLYLLLSVLPRQSSLESDRTAATFTKLRNLTVVLWTIYPVVWALSPLGLGLLTVSTEAVVIAYLDLISKVGFVVIALRGSDALRPVSPESAEARAASSAD